MLKGEGDKPVHFPRGNRFEFDEEVAEIFPNMAERSIPLYQQMHALHAKILVDEYAHWLLTNQLGKFKVLDIGASRLEFCQSISAEARRRDVDLGRMSYLACDSSQAMIDRAHQDFPGIEYELYNLADKRDTKFSGLKFHAVAMHYVMQFIPLAHRPDAYFRLGGLVREHGLLFYGEKETIQRVPFSSEQIVRIAEAAREHYIEFRMANGYSREEIEAKTAALQNSMWEVCYEDDTKRNLRTSGFTDFVPTCRMGLFHSFVAIKG